MWIGQTSLNEQFYVHQFCNIEKINYSLIVQRLHILERVTIL